MGMIPTARMLIDHIEGRWYCDAGASCDAMIVGFVLSAERL
jgi:hypothetical protein